MLTTLIFFSMGQTQKRCQAQTPPFLLSGQGGVSRSHSRETAVEAREASWSGLTNSVSGLPPRLAVSDFTTESSRQSQSTRVLCPDSLSIAVTRNTAKEHPGEGSGHRTFQCTGRESQGRNTRQGPRVRHQSRDHRECCFLTRVPWLLQHAFSARTACPGAVLPQPSRVSQE